MSTNRVQVNRRRAKVPPESRKRVAAACDSCNVRRIKCSGNRPCSQCEIQGRDCQYSTVRKTAQSDSSELLQLRAECAHLKKCLAATRSRGGDTHAPNQAEVARTDPGNVSVPASTEQSTMGVSQQSPDEGRLLQDLDGTARYLGGSSGATFLDSLKEFVATLFPLTFPNTWTGLRSSEAIFVGSLGFYQTHDSRPLPSASTSVPSLPSMTETHILLANLRYFAQDGNGDFASGGIYYWTDFEELLRSTTSPRMRGGGKEAPRRLGTLYAALAVASLVSSLTETECKTSGQECFAHAKMALGNPLDFAAFDDVETLGLLAFYLLEVNRRDLAHIHVSVAVHILLVHGVHRGWLVEESGKRLFWTIYVIERRISIMMGRPSMFSDAAIRISLPQDESFLPPADGLRAHIELSKISDYILRYVYDDTPEVGETNNRIGCIDRALNLLTSWIAGLPCYLQLNDGDGGNDRAVYELHMLHNQLVILTLRPILFTAVRKAVAGKYINPGLVIEVNHDSPRIRECGAAATRNLDLAQKMATMGHSQKLMHSGLHHIFNAAVVSLLHRVFPGAPVDLNASTLAFAEDSFRQAASPNDVYASDCLGVLLDLSSLVKKIQTQSIIAQGQSMWLAISETQVPPLVEEEPTSESTLPRETFDLHQSDFSEQFDELADWLQEDDLQWYER